MQKPADVPAPKPEKNSGDAGSGSPDCDLITRFQKYLGQILSVGRRRKRAPREQGDKPNGHSRKD